MATVARTFYSTSVGKKVAMAVTGFIVFGFVVVHMLGNLQLFMGPEKLDSYAAFLHSLGGLLWVFRAVLLVSAIVHIIAATQLSKQSWAARPQKYAMQRFRETTYAARTMRMGGPIILLFLIYHLMHFTFGTAHPSGPAFEPTAVYNNVVSGFQVWWASAVYMVASVVIGLHLYHGLWSMLQSVGINYPKWNHWRRLFALAFAAVITLGNLSMPTAVLLGYVQPV